MSQEPTPLPNDADAWKETSAEMPKIQKPKIQSKRWHRTEHATPHEYSEPQSTTVMPWPMPSISASSLSSLVTQPLRFVLMA